MARIISVHSFRGGTGKSNLTANLAAVLAGQGKRIAVIDTDIQSPGIHILFGLEGDKITATLNDYLWNNRSIKDAAIDVTPDGLPGKIFLVSSSMKPGEITRVLREGYDAQQLVKGLYSLVDDLSLDALMVDTHPGLNEETLLSLVISHVLVIVMRPDQQDYEGTGVTVTVAEDLQVPRMMLVVNKCPSIFAPEAVKAKVEETYGCDVAAVFPHSDDLMNLASGGIFALLYPRHPLTALYQQVAAQLLV
jgi:septum site-determining protein MinD